MATKDGLRSFDQLGRIVLPMKDRKTLGWEVGDSFEIFSEGDRIILQKYQTSCVFCKKTRDILDFQGKPVCRGCMKELVGLLASEGKAR